MIHLKSTEQILSELGERLRVLRLTQNLSQMELAQRCGVSLSSIRRFEANGQATVYLLVKVAQVLQVMDGFDLIFANHALSIAELENREQVQVRQRARKLSHKQLGAAL